MQVILIIIDEEMVQVLKFLLPFRVPEEILEAAEQKLESLENQKKKTKK